MRTTRTTAVVLAGAALGLPAAAAAENDDSRAGGPRLALERVTVPGGASVFAHRRGRRAEHLQARALRLARSLDREHGRHVRVAGERRRLRWAPVRGLRHRVRVLGHRLELAREPAPAAAPSAPSSTLQAIAACESGGDPAAVGGGGAYRGKYQFDYQTWESVGGTGDPAAAPEAEQDRRAAILYARAGSAPWPVCGR